jgi:hypothetical protein
MISDRDVWTGAVAIVKRYGDDALWPRFPSAAGRASIAGMGVQPIHLETLGALAAHGYGLNAMCSRCRHHCDLDMDALIAKLGARFRYVGKAVDAFLVCSACGSRQVDTQIHVMDAGRRSRFAD